MHEPKLAVYSIGHSNHEWGRFVELLTMHGVQRLVDVRSQPVSRYTPYFSYPDVGKNLAAKGIEYTFLGRELGGRPDGGEFYDDEGRVFYDRWAASAVFRDGLDRLIEFAAGSRTAMMCSEEDPSICHRRLLIARVIKRYKPEAQARETPLWHGLPTVPRSGDRGTTRDRSTTREMASREKSSLTHPIGVIHIRGNGRLQTDEELDEQERQAAGGDQKTLFETSVERPWKSLRSVLPKAQPPIFSVEG